MAVDIIDKAGNKVTATTDNYVSTKEWEIKIGDYVAYTPKAGTFSRGATEPTTGKSYAVLSGYSENTQSFKTSDTSFKWRIWDYSEAKDRITLIADNITSTVQEKKFYLKGAMGYNNGVKLLNDLCYTCYSNSELGAVGRSFSYNDIKAVLTSPPEYTYRRPINNLDYCYYPWVWQYEEYSQIGTKYTGPGDDVAVNTKALKNSEQKVYYNLDEGDAGPGYSLSKSGVTITNLRPTGSSLLSSTIYIDTIYRDMAVYGGAYSSGDQLDNFWLADRITYSSTSYGSFSICYVDYGQICWDFLFDSDGDCNGQNSASVRPVVDITLSDVVIGESGNGGEGTLAWSIRSTK